MSNTPKRGFRPSREFFVSLAFALSMGLAVLLPTPYQIVAFSILAVSAAVLLILTRCPTSRVAHGLRLLGSVARPRGSAATRVLLLVLLCGLVSAVGFVVGHDERSEPACPRAPEATIEVDPVTRASRGEVTVTPSFDPGWPDHVLRESLEVTIAPRHRLAEAQPIDISGEFPIEGTTLVETTACINLRHALDPRKPVGPYGVFEAVVLGRRSDGRVVEARTLFRMELLEEFPSLDSDHFYRNGGTNRWTQLEPGVVRADATKGLLTLTSQWRLAPHDGWQVTGRIRFPQPSRVPSAKRVFGALEVALGNLLAVVIGERHLGSYAIKIGTRYEKISNGPAITAGAWFLFEFDLRVYGDHARVVLTIDGEIAAYARLEKHELGLETPFHLHVRPRRGLVDLDRIGARVTGLDGCTSTR